MPTPDVPRPGGADAHRGAEATRKPVPERSGVKAAAATTDTAAMSSDDLAQMTREQVRRRERGLSKRVERILKEVDAAKADGLGLPWTSRTTGVDMSYEFEHARRWAVLDKEMKRAGADVVGDLGPARLEHWQVALDRGRLRPPEPLSAFRSVEPLGRRVGLPSPPPLQPPPGQARSDD